MVQLQFSICRKQSQYNKVVVFLKRIPETYKTGILVTGICDKSYYEMQLSF